MHDIVVANGGFPNKNVGDAFLVVWRPATTLAAIADMPPEDNIADKALTAICQSAEYTNYDSGECTTPVYPPCKHASTDSSASSPD